MTEKTQTQCFLYGPTFTELIAFPDEYHGKRIRVVGFVNLEFEGNAIYMHKEDYERGLMENGFGLAVSDIIVKKGINQTYVIVEGTFEANPRGYMSRWSGTIRDISRFDEWPFYRKVTPKE